MPEKIEPSEELLAEARIAGMIPEEKEFWQEVMDRMTVEESEKESAPKVTPRVIA